MIHYRNDMIQISIIELTAYSSHHICLNSRLINNVYFYWMIIYYLNTLLSLTGWHIFRVRREGTAYEKWMLNIFIQRRCVGLSVCHLEFHLIVFVVEGTCSHQPAGRISVNIFAGKCKRETKVGDCYFGYMSYAHAMVSEMYIARDITIQEFCHNLILRCCEHWRYGTIL